MEKQKQINVKTNFHVMYVVKLTKNPKKVYFAQPVLLIYIANVAD